MKVILLVFECWRRDHLKAYGYERDTTPFLDSVMASDRGVRWTNPRAVAGHTRPTYKNFGAYMGHLTRAGIPTMCWTANPEPCSPIRPSVKQYKGFGPVWVKGEKAPRPVAREMVEKFTRTYKNAGDFCAILHFVETHAAYAPGPHLKDFVGDRLYREQRAKWGQFCDHGLTTIDRFNGLIEWDGPEHKLWALPGSRLEGKNVATCVAFYIAAYDAAIRSVDSALSPIFEIFPDADIYVTGDHGESLGERGFMHHAYGNFPELLRVPLLARLRSPSPQRVVEAAVNHHHLMTSVVKSFGLEWNGIGLPFSAIEFERQNVRRLKEQGIITGG